ncbi:MAG: GSU2403 family nucleotidyltransferase fold protein, partial [Beijerinckiaceae bacterium]
MQEIGLQFRTMFSELVQRSLDDRFLKDFPPDGSFIRVPVRGRDYWYFNSAMQNGKRKRSYVGPASDPAVSQRVEEFVRLKSSARDRRMMVTTLNRIGLPGPDNFTGNVIEALSSAGFFRLRGVLVGTVAFQAYSGLLGMRFPNASMQTGDADLAQFHSVSAAIDDTMAPMLESLQSVDPAFREIPHETDSRKTTRYSNDRGFKVE